MVGLSVIPRNVTRLLQLSLIVVPQRVYIATSLIRRGFQPYYPLQKCPKLGAMLFDADHAG